MFMSRDGAYYPPDVLRLSKRMECPGALPQPFGLMDEVQHKAASLSSGLGMRARVQDCYTHELLTTVMVHIAILAHDAVCCLLGHGKTQVEHISLCIIIHPYLPCREL
jgi:hypothetical protein